MKRIVRPSLAFFLFACGMTVLLPAGAMQDGPIRQRLKERLMERNHRESGHATDTDAGAGITRPGDYRFTIRHDGLARMYRIHVPAGYRPAVPMPLLVALHGGGGNMDYQARDDYYGQIVKSESKGFVAVFPNGYSRLKSGKFATWNAGDCCGRARDDHIDDVGFIRQVVADVTHRLNIDRNRIYATGMSNGGMMAYRLACDMSDVFKAVAAVAGTDNTDDCQPGRPVSVLHIHAKDDSHVLFDGGAGPDASDKSKVTDFRSVPDTVSRWVRHDGCAATPRRILESAGAYCEVYSSCQGKAEVQLCVTETGGHSWPGAEKTRGAPASQAISANDVMWDFFDRH